MDELGVYVRDRGVDPTRMRVLSRHEKGCYVIGRLTDDHDLPDIILHNGRISKRHAVLLHEPQGYWSLTSIGRHGSELKRGGEVRALGRGDAIAIQDDDVLLLQGSDYSITFKTDLSETVGQEYAYTTLDDDAAEDDHSDWRNALVKVYEKASPIEKLLIGLCVVAIAAAMVF
jgi:hypothetical protein